MSSRRLQEQQQLLAPNSSSSSSALVSVISSWRWNHRLCSWKLVDERGAWSVTAAKVVRSWHRTSGQPQRWVTMASVI